jgi:hypothetical protein
MKVKNKANLHLYKGITTIIRSKSQYPKLMLAEGFLAYQWEKDGVIISTAKSATYTANAPGKYRARFSRLSTAPTSTQWNRWSATVTITETTSAAAIAEAEVIEIDSLIGEEDEFVIDVFPNPVTTEDIFIDIHSASGRQVEVEMLDLFGKSVYKSVLLATDEQSRAVIANSTIVPGIYILRANDGKSQITQKIIVQR